jgi:hypothetical protein
MSKLDQIKALGAAKAASRNSSDGIAEGREGQDGKVATRVGLRRPELEAGSVAQPERGPTQGLRARVKIPSESVGIKASSSEAKPKFDRTEYHRAYMKEYMRKRRQKESKT